MTMTQTIEQLSETAMTALVNAQAPREGGKVVGSALVLAELARLELIGPLHGLTRRGVIVRERHLARLMDELF